MNPRVVRAPHREALLALVVARGTTPDEALVAFIRARLAIDAYREHIEACAQCEEP